MSEILKAINIEQTYLDDPTSRIPARAFMEMLHFSEEKIGELGIGVRVGRNFRPNTFREVGYAAMMSKNIVEALNLNQRYQPLTQELGVTHIELDGDEARIVWRTHYEDDEYMRPMTDAVFGGYFTLGLWMAWIDVKTFPAALYFCHAPTEYEGVFKEAFGCSVEFHSERNELLLPREVAEKPLPQYNPNFVEMISQRMDRMMEKHARENTICDRVADLIEALLPTGDCSLTKIATIIGASERTVRRRLKSYDKSYNEILEQVRRESCEIHLCDSKIELSDLAFQLGYSEQTAFNRAFRHWYGETPIRLREALMNETRH